MKKNIDLNVNENELTFQTPNRTRVAKNQSTLDFFGIEEPKVEEKKTVTASDVVNKIVNNKPNAVASKKEPSKDSATKTTSRKIKDNAETGTKNTNKNSVKKSAEKKEVKSEQKPIEDTKEKVVAVEDKDNENNLGMSNRNIVNETESKKGDEITMENEERMEAVQEEKQPEVVPTEQTEVVPAEQVEEITPATSNEKELDIFSLEVVEDTLPKKEAEKESEEKKAGAEKGLEAEKEPEAGQEQEVNEEKKESLWKRIVAKFKKFIKNASVKISICKIVVKNKVAKEVKDKTILKKLSKGWNIAKTKTKTTLHNSDIALNNTASNVRRLRFENRVKGMLAEQDNKNMEVTRKDAKYNEQLENAENLLKAGIAKDDFNILKPNDGEEFFKETLGTKDEKKVKRALEAAIDKLSETRFEVASQKEYIEKQLLVEIEEANKEKTNLYREGIRAINEYQIQAKETTMAKAVEFIDNPEVIKEKVRESSKENYDALLETLTNYQTQIEEKNKEIETLSQKYMGDTMILSQNQTMLVYKASKLKRKIENYRKYFTDEKLVDNLIAQIERMNIKSDKTGYAELCEDLNTKQQKMRAGIIKEFKKLNDTYLLDDNLKNHKIFNIEANETSTKEEKQADQMDK